MKFKRSRKSALFAIAILALVCSARAADDSPAPDFTIPNMASGEPITLADFGGKVVYVDFWASWCGPCLRSFPFMQELHEKYAESGLVIIAINLDQNPQEGLDFLEEHPVTFLIGQNTKGDVAERYEVIAMPSSYIVGRDGNIAEVHYGFKSKDKIKMAALIDELL